MDGNVEAALAQCPRPDTSGGPCVSISPYLADGKPSARRASMPERLPAMRRLLPTPCRNHHNINHIVCCDDDCVSELDAEVAGFQAVGALTGAKTAGFFDVCKQACRLFADEPAKAAGPQQISLCRSLPPPSNNAVCKLGSLSLGFSVQDVRALVLPTAHVSTFPDFLRACDPPSRAWFLRSPFLECPDGIEHLMLFTDGSFHLATPDAKARMGWAVAVFDGTTCAAKLQCCGVLSGLVPPVFLEGGQQPSAFVAECAALTFAGLLATTNYPACDVAFVGDCQSALACASGDCSISGGNAQALVRNMHCFRSCSSCGALRYEHVRSHESNFGNEVVDSAAKLAAAGIPLGRHPWGAFDFWGRAGGSRLGLLCRSMQGDPTLPRFDGCHLGDDEDLAGMDAPSITGPFLPSSASPAEQSAVEGQLCVRLASANVLTLNSARQGPELPVSLGKQVAKPALLAQSLLEARVHVVAVRVQMRTRHNTNFGLPPLLFRA